MVLPLDSGRRGPPTTERRGVANAAVESSSELLCTHSSHPETAASLQTREPSNSLVRLRLVFAEAVRERPVVLASARARRHALVHVGRFVPVEGPLPRLSKVAPGESLRQAPNTYIEVPPIASKPRRVPSSPASHED